MNTNAFRRLQSACAWALFSILLGNGALGVSARQTEQKPEPSAATAEQAVPMPLELGKPIERELGGETIHRYGLTMQAGDYAYLEIQQKKFDIVVDLFGPDEKQIAQVAGVEGMFSLEPVFLTAETTGTYRLDIRGEDPEMKPGRYVLKLVELRAAEQKDRDRTKAQREHADGLALLGKGSRTDREAAIKKFENALTLWRSTGDQAGEARTLHVLGYTLHTLGQEQQSLEIFQRALPLRRIVGDQIGEIGTLTQQAIVLDFIGEKKKAVADFESAISLARAAGDISQEAIALYSIGVTYANLGEHQKAINCYANALSLLRMYGDRRQEAVTLNNIGVTYRSLGEPGKALEAYNQALPIHRETENRWQEGATLNNIGAVYKDLGENQKALDFYTQALQLRRDVGDRRGEGFTLVNLGVLYNLSGENRKALEFFQLALAVTRATNNRQVEAGTLNSIADVYADLGEREKALEFYQQSLSLRRSVGDRSGEGTTLGSLGKLYGELGDYQKAAEYFTQSMLPIRETGERILQAYTLYQWARLDHGQNKVASARMKIEEAIKLTESIRDDVGRQDLRTSFFTIVRGYYDLYLDVLMLLHEREPAAGHAAQAFQASERARARTLLELLTEARADIRQGVDPVFLEREKALQKRITAKADLLIRFKSAANGEKQAPELEKELTALTTELDKVRADIRQKSPRYATLTQPQPLSLKEIQDQLDADTMLLEYALGDEGSYLWAVTRDGLNAFKLPKSKEIEDAARKFHAALVREGDSLRRRAQSAPQPTTAVGDDSARAAEELSGMILGPVADKLDKKRIVVVADGALQYIPFGALPLPRQPRNEKQDSASTQNSKPKTQNTPSSPLLIERCEVVNLPSATALALQRRELTDRRPAAKQVAVIADPVFDKDDVRVIVAKAANARPETIAKRRETPADIREKPAEASALALPRAPFDSIKKATRGTPLGEGVIPRLSYAGREARNILALVTKDQSRQALDFDASLDAATSPDLSGYKIVHFATHGVLNAVHPELSGILLSLVDRQGVSRNGFLGMLDIFNLNLPAETVVLSACQTGLGKEIKGEGLAGLSRAFMYAGARRVVVSLWSVDDQATSELMTRFYRKVLRDKQRPAAALRAAQLELMREKQWKSPFYWAPFVVQGEWN